MGSSSNIILGSTRKYFKGSGEIWPLFSGSKGALAPPWEGLSILGVGNVFQWRWGGGCSNTVKNHTCIKCTGKHFENCHWLNALLNVDILRFPKLKFGRQIN